MRKLVSIVVLSLASAVSFGAAGCSKSYIPNTDVEDSSENKKVIAFCEQYRHAVEDKDVGTLLKLASPRYYEDGEDAKLDIHTRATQRARASVLVAPVVPSSAPHGPLRVGQPQKAAKRRKPSAQATVIPSTAAPSHVNSATAQSPSAVHARSTECAALGPKYPAQAIT